MKETSSHVEWKRWRNLFVFWDESGN